jgi:hypothetical protein
MTAEDHPIEHRQRADDPVAVDILEPGHDRLHAAEL